MLELAMISIFTFDKSTVYLRAYINSLPRKGWGEIQRWADHLGVQASYISQFLAGHRMLSVDQTLSLARYMGLKKGEVDFFMALTEKERAASHQTKKYYDEKLIQLRLQSQNLTNRLPKDKELSEQEKSVFYSSWLYSAIRIFCSLSPNGKTFDEIQDQFNLKRAEIVPLLEFLCQAGLCKENQNLYSVGPQRTHLESSSPYIHRHRQNWRIKCLSQIENAQPDELVFSAPFSINHDDFLLLRERLSLFLEEFYATVKATEPKFIGFINIDLMKLR